MSIDLAHVKRTAYQARDLALRALVGAPLVGNPCAVAEEAAEQALALREALDEQEGEQKDKIDELELELAEMRLDLDSAKSENTRLEGRIAKLELQIQAHDAEIDRSRFGST